MAEPKPTHRWPADGEHLWGPWRPKTGMPKPTRYRMCVHPECHEAQTEAAPIAPMQQEH